MIGCTDGGCVLRDNRKVVHTNGGCLCLRGLEPATRVEVRKRLAELRQIKDKGT